MAIAALGGGWGTRGRSAGSFIGGHGGGGGSGWRRRQRRHCRGVAGAVRAQGGGVCCEATRHVEEAATARRRRCAGVTGAVGEYGERGRRRGSVGAAAWRGRARGALGSGPAQRGGPSGTGRRARGGGPGRARRAAWPERGPRRRVPVEGAAGWSRGQEGPGHARSREERKEREREGRRGKRKKKKRKWKKRNGGRKRGGERWIRAGITALIAEPVGHARRERDAQVEGKQGAGYGCRVFGESGDPAEQGGFRKTGVRVSRRDLELNDEAKF